MSIRLTPEFQELLSKREEQRWVNWGLLKPDCPECHNGILILPPVRYKGQINPHRICSNCGRAFLFSMLPLPRPYKRWYEDDWPEVLQEQKECWENLQPNNIFIN